MDRPATRIIAPIYGYVVCLVSIIAAVSAMGVIVSSIFNMGRPLLVNDYRYGSTNLTSFDAYKNDMYAYRPTPAGSPGNENIANPPSDTDLRATYEAAKASKIEMVRWEATRDIVMSLFAIAVSTALFFAHWTWLRRMERN